MKSLTRFFALFLAAILCSTFLSACVDKPVPPVSDNTTDAAVTDALVEESPVYDFAYKENEEGGITIIKYLRTKRSERVNTIVIPKMIEGKKVTAIGDAAFWGGSWIEKIVLPDYLRVIEDRAFLQCSSLKHINIPESVYMIGHMAFYECVKLESVVLPESLSVLGDEAFSLCSMLKSVVIPGGITSFGDSVFLKSGLEKIHINEGLKVIGERAFAITDLREAVIPSSVKTIKKGAFGGCSLLSSIVISEGVTTIEELAFSGCGIKELKIPKSVKVVDESVFSSCKALERVLFEGNAPELFLNDLYYNHYSNVIINYTSGSEGFTTPVWNTYLTYEVGKENAPLFVDDFMYAETDGNATILRYVGNSENVFVPSVIDGMKVSKIGASAFLGNATVRTVELPESITEIGIRAFAYTSLEKIVVGREVTVIGDCAFEMCRNLSSISLPETLVKIGKSAFANCSKLTEVELPESLKEIGEDAFMGVDLD